MLVSSVKRPLPSPPSSKLGIPASQVCGCPLCTNMDHHWLKDIVCQSARSMGRRAASVQHPTKASRILDFNGVHSVQWAVELAQRYPQAHVLHLAQHDIGVQARLQQGQPLPQNCTVRVGSVLDGRHVPLQSGLFDFIHARFLLLAHQTTALPHLFKRMYQLTRPGGRIELLDSTSLTTALVPLTMHLPRLNACLQQRMDQAGVKVHGLNQYSTWLYEAGFSKVDMETVRIPVSHQELEGLGRIWGSWCAEEGAAWRDLVHHEEQGLYVEVWCFTAQRPAAAPSQVDRAIQQAPSERRQGARTALKAKYAKNHATVAGIQAC